MVTVDQLPGSVRALYPFRPHSFVTPGGATMSYLDEGPRDSTAVLMLHGNPTWSFFYRDLVRRLAPAHRCIAPDHIGMGLSDKPADYPYVLEQRIRDIAALVDRLGLRRVHLVVHDWGGAIGFGLATRRPDLIGRIVVLNTAAFRSSRIPASIAFCRTRLLGTFCVRAFNAFAGPAVRLAMHQRVLTTAERVGYLFPYDSWAHRVAVDAFVKDIPLESTHPSHATLEAIEAALPTLARHPLTVVWGGRDFCFNDHFLSEWRRRFPAAAIHRLPEAGHYVLDDAGTEALDLVNRALPPEAPRSAT